MKLSNRLTIKEILERTIEHFTKYEIHNPRLDAEVLLADLLGLERIQLYVRYDQPLKKDEIDQYRERIILRSKKVPVQYIVGHQEFMSLDFVVGKGVLIPRPETEHLVETVINFIKEKEMESPLIVDIGTGSGAIAVSLAHYISNARVVGVDISPEALEIAKKNVEKHLLIDRVTFLNGSFLKPIINAGLKPQVVVSNPPYIRRNDLEKLQAEVKMEPKLALDGGIDGLDAYRQIIAQSVEIDPDILAFEVGFDQARDVAEMLEKNFAEIHIIKDLAGINRVVIGKRNQAG